MTRQTAQDALEPPTGHDHGGGRPAVCFTARPLEDPEFHLRILNSPSRDA